MLRELRILRKLTEMKQNNFTTKIVDIIIPQSSIFYQRDDSVSCH